MAKPHAIAKLRNDGWNPSRPWVADLIVDGKTLTGWAHGFKSKKALIAHIQAVGGIEIA